MRPRSTLEAGLLVVPDRNGPVNSLALRQHIRGLPEGVVGPYFITSDLYSQVGNVQGNAGRDFIICPGLNQWDLSLFKNFTVVERTRPPVSLGLLQRLESHPVRDAERHGW